MATSTLPYPGTASRTRSTATVRVLLHGGALAAAALALWPAARSGAAPDADLAWLLRMMAALKGVMLLGGLALLDWRLRRPTPVLFQAGYLGLAWLAAAGVATIWRLSALGPATIALHAAAAALVVLACLDREFVPRPVQQAIHR